MEWVETTGHTLEEATARAVDLLGVDDADAEIVVLTEPRPGWFGRTRGEARVRARVRPARLRPKLDRRDRRRKSARDDRPPSASIDSPAPAGRGETTAASSESSTSARGKKRRGSKPTKGSAHHGSSAADVEMSADAAEIDQVVIHPLANPTLADELSDGPLASDAPRKRAARNTDSLYDGHDDEQGDDMERDGTIDKDRAADFLLGLAECLGAGATAKVIETPEAIEVELDGDDLGLLIGPRGQTLQAVQELTRAVAQRGLPQQRLRVDVSGYRKRRAEALSRFAVQIANEVASSGVAKALEPMSSPDRKVVHDAVGDVAGVVSSSDGEDPNRRVVISPA